ncbi:hypothetical protein [Geosporobacter ferrireducens]|uniref:hypothetical protein n=1 Tax=Geosporobacter ferrireducens TaxID=1424294 RepID=UPI0012EAA6E7|nr:hypothetical protein [Geosporobacter ferrireducens]
MERKSYNPYGPDLYDIDIEKRKEHKKQEKIMSEMIQELKRIDDSLQNIKYTINHLLK